MIMRFLAVAVLASLSLGFAPVPFPKVKKQTGPTAEELLKSINGTYRVVSYEYGNNLAARGIAVARATPFTEVEIKDGTWTQIRDLNGKRYNTTMQLKLEPKPIVSELTLGYNGNPVPTFTGVMHNANLNRLTIAYGRTGQAPTDPFAPLAQGQYRWVLERIK